MARIALKVDVDTLRGTCEGVPRLLDALARVGARATFLWSLGPDHTGWALRRVFRPGFYGKVARTSVLKHYGLRTLLYGVVLPAPDIGRRAAALMRSVRAAGHECGIHAWDHVLWQDNVRYRGRTWTETQMRLAHERFAVVFDAAPSTHGAAGWQMNADAFRQIDAWGLAYASDGRGAAPYRPLVDGRLLEHVQLPTTLPTFDELLGVDGRDEAAVSAEILRATDVSHDQVFTLHAELEGGLLRAAFDSLLDGWQAQGHQLVSLGGLFAGLDRGAVAVRRPHWGTVPGRSGQVIV